MMMKRLAVVCAAIGALSARAADEAVAFTYDNEAISGMCDGDSLWGYSGDVADSWDSQFSSWTSLALWDSSELWYDLAVDDEDWIGVDDDVDPYGVDHADVGLYVGHGHHSCTGVENSLILMGDDEHGDCSMHTTDMEFGVNGGDLDIVVLNACETAHKCVWAAGGYSAMADTNGSFRMLLGFHGVSYLNGFSGGDMSTFTSQSRTTGIGENWIDTWYDWWIGDNNDRCPTGVIWGESSSVRDSYWNNGGWSDRRSTIATNSSFYYIDGCDPDNGVEL
jgi:hypothetical protein